jgi:macrolide transport system ATP-binding/permease protein
MIELDDIHKEYLRGKVRVPVLKGISLTIARGEMVALMGVSGSGKTTLVNLIGALDRPTSGLYRLDGREVSRLSVDERALLRSREIGFVFQNFNLLPRLSALENVMMPLAYAGGDLTEARDRARALLERVGLGDRLDHEPSRLSGGEQQRVAIARALINRGRLLIADEPTGNLDSQTGEEILTLFRRLNAEDGLTVLLVTHDPGVAVHAGRIVQIRDGLLIDDERPRPTMEDWPPTPAAAPERRGGRPLVATTVSLALRSLRRNALRSALTTLGIIIGVASLIAIAEIGKGSSTAIRAMLRSMGVDNILVQSGAATTNGVSLGSGSIKTLTPEDAEAIAHECPAVSSLAPIVYTRQQVLHGNRNWVPAYFYGTTPDFLRVREWEDLDQGEPFTDRDVADVAIVCLLGRTLADELFGAESPVGREVYVNDVPLRVLGVLARKGANIIGEDQDDILLAPWTTVKYRISASAGSNPAPATIGPHNPLARRFPRLRPNLYPSQTATQAVDTPRLERFSNVDSILVRAQTTDEIPAAMGQIRTLLHERHKAGEAREEDFTVRDFTEVVTAVQATVGLVAGLLLCVSLISLVVGGVGIMNIMLVSVTERYREIGLRMAVGARPRDILRQFLVEAVVLCLLGGAAGIAVGRGTSQLVRHLAGWPTEASLWAVAAAVSVSITVGVVFGYYPAWRASRLDPIEALRFE